MGLDGGSKLEFGLKTGAGMADSDMVSPSLSAVSLKRREAGGEGFRFHLDGGVGGRTTTVLMLAKLPPSPSSSGDAGRAELDGEGGSVAAAVAAAAAVADPPDGDATASRTALFSTVISEGRCARVSV
jgi:hypothetical protein